MAPFGDWNELIQEFLENIVHIENCTYLNETQKHVENVARSLSALACFVVALPMFILLIRHKMYKTLLQRLFLYLTAVVLIHLGIITMGFDLKDKLNCYYWIQEFFRSWSSATMFILIMTITLHLVRIVSLPMSGNNRTTKTGNHSNKKSAVVLFLVLALFFPLTYMWIPILGAIQTCGNCSLSIQSCGNCSLSLDVCYDYFPVFLYQIVSGAMLRAAMIIVIISILALLCILCKTSVHFKKIKSRPMRRKIKHTLVLMAFFLASLAGETLYFAITMVNKICYISYALLVVHEIAMPIFQLVLLFGLSVYLYPFKKMSSKNFFTKMNQCCKILIAFFHAQNRRLKTPNKVAPSNLKHNTDRSTTHFNIEYTGAFTSITDQKVGARNYGNISNPDNLQDNVKNGASLHSACFAASKGNDDLAKSSKDNLASGQKFKINHEASASCNTELQFPGSVDRPIFDIPEISDAPSTCENSNPSQLSNSSFSVVVCIEQGESNRSALLETSELVESNTHFSIGYTGEFTTITDFGIN